MNRRDRASQTPLDLGRAAYERVQASKADRAKRGPEGKAREHRAVLITGVGNYWGGRIALALEQEPSIGDLLGMDVSGPATTFSRLEYIHMALRSPFLADMLRHRRVDTVVHMEWRDPDRGREKMFETNVLGTRALLSACKEAGVRKLIVRSSTAVYGPSPDNPNFLPERYPVRARPRDPHLRDQVECESDYREFLSHRYAKPILTVLRFAHIVGPSAPSLMNRYLRKRKLPSVLGYDPLLQFIHENDMVAAVVAAVNSDAAGAVNVAADGVVPLTRVAALLGKKLSPQVLPLMPALESVASYLPRASKPALPSAYLKFLCNGDTRRMKEELNFTPQLSAVDTLRALGGGVGEDDAVLGRTAPGYEEYVQRCLDEVLEKDEANPGA